MSFFPVVFAGYLTSLALYFTHFEFQKPQALAIAKKMIALTVVIHAGSLVWIYVQGGAGAVTGRPEYLIALLAVLASILMEWIGRAGSLMIFSLPLVLLISLLGFLRTGHPVTGEDPRWLWLHVGAILTGIVSLLMAVACAFMYLLQSYQLKSKHLGNAFLRLPSLNTLERLHFRTLCGGVIFFSLGILTGLFWAQDLRGLGQVFHDPKVILSFTTCFLYWVILGFHLSPLRRGQKIAAGTALVFVLLLLTIVSTHMSSTALHRGL